MPRGNSGKNSKKVSSDHLRQETTQAMDLASSLISSTLTTESYSGANSVQISGDHYKSLGIEPWDYINVNNLDFFEGNVVKLVTRWRAKGGEVDLQKAIHFLEKMLEMHEKGTY